MVGVVTAIVGISVFAVGTALSINESRKARKDQKKAAEVASKRRAIESRKAALAGLEDGRQAIGSVVNTAAQTGGSGGSGAQGAQASLQSQVGANVTFNQQLLTFAMAQEKHLQKSLDRQNRAQTFSAIASIGSSAASFGMSSMARGR